jgi:hypothetical protein
MPLTLEVVQMMSRITAAEIFTHPEDLCLIVFQPKGQQKWGVQIARGKGHNYKMMLDNGIDQPPHWDSRQAAVDGICEILSFAVEAATKEMQEPSSLLAAVSNPKGLKEEEMWNCLKAEDIQEIKERFTKADAVDTSKVPLTRLATATTS